MDHFPLRMTYATAMVLQALDRGYRHGFDIIDATRLRSGTVYPLLRRLEEAGLVHSEWEPVATARAENRPPRRYYELTPTAAPMLRLAQERFPTPAAIPGTDVTVDPSR
jgi:PadR family transcriptional regulator PadR